MSRMRNRRSTSRAPFTSEKSRPEEPPGGREAREKEGSGEVASSSMEKPKVPQVPKSSARRKRNKGYKRIQAYPSLPSIPECPVLQPIMHIPEEESFVIRDWRQDITLELPLRCPICQLTFAFKQRLRQHIIVHVMVEGRNGVIKSR